jgi:GGDEF domain-containing protein
VVDTLRVHLRSHDLIVRYIGDEFACALRVLDIEKATESSVLINVALAAEV